LFFIERGGAGLASRRGENCHLLPDTGGRGKLLKPARGRRDKTGKAVNMINKVYYVNMKLIDTCIKEAHRL